ncbi:unnamed protein product [Clonostachys solani]|uniref:Uncharacterized protein n=1 Tax=Clonostachys solani TaxID=160281 RepID=A0A9N9ZGB1_9HYPO|nr:unnamed protein product [Clonostachys solani]
MGLTNVSISNDQFRILVDYFQHETSKSLSCHEEMQREICSTIVPMAMASQHVMAAMLCVASSHRLSVGLEQTEVNVFKLHAVSARLLQDAIGCATRQDVLVMALATSLVLCLSNIVSSSSHSEEWGVHLKGTSALIKQLDESRYRFEKSTRVLLRFYTSLTAIAAGRGIPSDVPLYAVQSDSGMQDYIDDLAGFSTSLKPIIDAMQALDRSRGQTEIHQLTHVPTMGHTFQ